MRIRIYLDENTPLEENPVHEFEFVPRVGDTLRHPNGNEYTVEDVTWNLPDSEPAYPDLTVSIKHLERDSE